MDGNLHAGDALIKHDPNPQNVNGKLFMQFLQQKPLTNGGELTQHLRRQRKLEARMERAVLDFIIRNQSTFPVGKRERKGKGEIGL